MSKISEEIAGSTPDRINMHVDSWFDQQEDFEVMKEKFDAMLKDMDIRRAGFARLVGYSPSQLSSLISRNKKRGVFPIALVRLMTIHSYLKKNMTWEPKSEDFDNTIDKFLELCTNRPETRRRLKEAKLWNSLEKKVK